MGEGIQGPGLVSSIKHDVPPELNDLISEALDPDRSPRRHVGSEASDFGRAARRLANELIFRSLPPEERIKAIAQALRNFNGGGTARFPHTANFDVVYANALTILLKVIRIPAQVLSAGDKDGKRPKLERHRDISAEVSGSAALCLGFFTLRREYYVGDGQGGRSVGAKYLSTASFTMGDYDSMGPARDALQLAVDSPCGLEFICDRVGIVCSRQGRGWLEDPF